MCRILIIAAIIACTAIVGAHFVETQDFASQNIATDTGDEDQTPSDEEDGESEFA